MNMNYCPRCGDEVKPTCTEPLVVACKQGHRWLDQRPIIFLGNHEGGTA